MKTSPDNLRKFCKLYRDGVAGGNGCLQWYSNNKRSLAQVVTDIGSFIRWANANNKSWHIDEIDAGAMATNFINSIKK